MRGTPYLRHHLGACDSFTSIQVKQLQDFAFHFGQGNSLTRLAQAFVFHIQTERIDL